MSEDFQEEYIGDILETVEGNPDICGYAIWQMNDNRTYHRNSPGQSAKQMAGWSIAGIFDRHREPKLAVETVCRHFTRHQAASCRSRGEWVRCNPDERSG